MNILEINTIKNYKIYIGSELIFRFSELLNANGLNGKLLIITDENIYKIYGSKIFKFFHEFEYSLHVIKPGEETKTIKEAMLIYEKMLDKDLFRDTLVVAFGGGVVGDLAGFVSSTFMRGTKYIQIPTTLLSQVDSSVGGKVAVNFQGYKNLIGSFYQPDIVIIDTEFLKTLNSEELISGIGEVLKYGFIKNYSLLSYIDKNTSKIMEFNDDVLINTIIESLKIKKEIVEIDEKESNIRMILNFGHTIGHGIESLYDFKKYKHGIAILIGMFYESKLAYKRGLISKEYMDEIYEIISKVTIIPIFSDEEIINILNNIKRDKKNKNGKPVLILPENKGKVKIFQDIEYQEIQEVLKEGIDYDN